jgi:hypothetical protein
MAREFRVGERVRFLHEKMEGVVQAILSKSRLEVLVDDFEEFEIGTDEIVHIHSAEQVLRDDVEDDSKPIKSSAPPVDDKRPPSLILLRTKERNYELVLLNPGSMEAHINVFLKVRQKYRGLNSAVCLPRDKFFLAKLDLQEFNNAQQIFIQLMLYPIGEFSKPIPPFTMEINLKTDVFGHKAERIDGLEGEGYKFVLEESDKPVIVAIDHAALANLESNFRINRGRQNAPEVVDLHIEKLVSNPARLNAGSMLGIQLETFERKITDANLHKVPSMVFIHGVGTGTLKREMRERLKGYEFVKNFESADPVKYGNGATVVFF